MMHWILRVIKIYNKLYIINNMKQRKENIFSLITWSIVSFRTPIPTKYQIRRSLSSLLSSLSFLNFKFHSKSFWKECAPNNRVDIFSHSIPGTILDQTPRRIGKIIWKISEKEIKTCCSSTRIRHFRKSE